MAQLDDLTPVEEFKSHILRSAPGTAAGCWMDLFNSALMMHHAQRLGANAPELIALELTGRIEQLRRTTKLLLEAVEWACSEGDTPPGWIPKGHENAVGRTTDRCVAYLLDWLDGGDRENLVKMLGDDAGVLGQQPEEDG